MRRIFLLALLLSESAFAQHVNPQPGDVWTYNGPTLGAGWAEPTVSGQVAITSGGTGASTVAGALQNLTLQIPGSCDGFTADDGVITSGDATFTSASANFTAADVGKPFSAYGAGAAGVSLVTTIASRNSPNSVELATAASTTVSGAKWGYGSNYTAVINAALAAGVNLPKGKCGHTDTINLAAQNILLGKGIGTSELPQTTLVWLGPVGGRSINLDTGAVASGIQLGHFNVDGLCAAAEGIRLKGLASSTVFPLITMNQTSAGIILDAYAAEYQNVTIIAPQSVQTHACSASAKGIRFGLDDGVGNINHVQVFGPRVYTRNGTGFECGNADSNQIYGLFGQRVSGGTGLSIDLRGSTAAGVRHCRSNSFYWADPQGGTTARNNTQAAVNNYIEINSESGAPNPVVETGATLYMRKNNGRSFGFPTTTSSKTGDYTVKASESGLFFDNVGATAAITLRLPPATEGLNNCYAQVTNQRITIAADGTETIALGAKVSAAGGNVVLRAVSPNSTVCLLSPDIGYWIVTSMSGAAQVN